MRVNLFLGRPELVRSGHLNLDASLQEPADDRVPCSVNDWPGVSPNEAEEIVVQNVLEFLPPAHVGEVFSYWASRLALGGKLTVVAVDFQELAWQAREAESPCDFANQTAYAGRQSAHTVETITGLFEHFGLKVVWKMLRGTQAVVEGVRNG